MNVGHAWERVGPAAGSTARTGPPRLIYFSSTSENTHRFVAKLGAGNVGGAIRLPLLTRDETYIAAGPYVLMVPTYGAAGKGYVPKQVIKFLNVATNRAWCRGVIAAGNTNFGEDFCRAGDIVAAKLGVPYLYRFELMGTEVDLARVSDGLEQWWKQQSISA